MERLLFTGTIKRVIGCFLECQSCLFVFRTKFHAKKSIIWLEIEDLIISKMLNIFQYKFGNFPPSLTLFSIMFALLTYLRSPGKSSLTKRGLSTLIMSLYLSCYFPRSILFSKSFYFCPSWMELFSMPLMMLFICLDLRGDILGVLVTWWKLYCIWIEWVSFES